MLIEIHTLSFNITQSYKKYKQKFLDPDHDSSTIKVMTKSQLQFLQTDVFQTYLIWFIIYLIYIQIIHVCLTKNDVSTYIHWLQQGKSEGFESCDRPIVRKRPIWVKIGDVLYYVTLKFDGWPSKTKGHLSFAVSSFVQHFIAIGEFKLELQSGNDQFGSNSTIFTAVWPWNLMYDLEK